METQVVTAGKGTAKPMVPRVQEPVRIENRWIQIVAITYATFKDSIIIVWQGEAKTLQGHWGSLFP